MPIESSFPRKAMTHQLQVGHLYTKRSPAASNYTVKSSMRKQDAMLKEQCPRTKTIANDAAGCEQIQTVL